MEEWQRLTELKPYSYTCGYCGEKTGSKEGYYSGGRKDGATPMIYICGGCNRPTYVSALYHNQTPAPRLGIEIIGLPKGNALVGQLYDEARRCTTTSAYTASVMACRKIISHIGVDKGADEGESFKFYIDYLVRESYINSHQKKWADKIREIANIANHEIIMMTEDDAKLVLDFTAILLKNLYEFPALADDYFEKKKGQE